MSLDLPDSPSPPEPSAPILPWDLGAQGDAAAIAHIQAAHHVSLARIAEEGMKAYGDLRIEDADLARGFARIVHANLSAEKAANRTGVGVEDVLVRLVEPDIYLCQGLVCRSELAWARFDSILEGAFRSVRAHFVGRTPTNVLLEIRSSVLGTFFIDNKVETYRANAPIGAWARQVVFNLFLQKVNRLRSGNEPGSLSQFTDQEGDGAENLLPPSPALAPPELLHQAEWGSAMEKAVPAALARLDRDERRMMDVLPNKTMTQVQLSKELSVSAYKLNRWYKEVRRRFLRNLTHELRLIQGLDEGAAEHLMGYLEKLWEERS